MRDSRRPGLATTKDLIQAIEATGCTVRKARAGHPRVFRANGTFLMSIPLTGDYRSIRNAWARFNRKIGLEPPLR
jgi:hypothetical protein